MIYHKETLDTPAEYATECEDCPALIEDTESQCDNCKERDAQERIKFHQDFFLDFELDKILEVSDETQLRALMALAIAQDKDCTSSMGALGVLFKDWVEGIVEGVEK